MSPTLPGQKGLWPGEAGKEELDIIATIVSRGQLGLWPGGKSDLTKTEGCIKEKLKDKEATPSEKTDKAVRFGTTDTQDFKFKVVTTIEKTNKAVRFAVLDTLEEKSTARSYTVHPKKLMKAALEGLTLEEMEEGVFLQLTSEEEVEERLAAAPLEGWVPLL